MNGFECVVQTPALDIYGIQSATISGPIRTGEVVNAIRVEVAKFERGPNFELEMSASERRKYMEKISAYNNVYYAKKGIHNTTGEIIINARECFVFHGPRRINKIKILEKKKISDSSSVLVHTNQH